MAKLIQNKLIITVSQLLKDSDPEHVLIDTEIVNSIEAVVAQLASEAANGLPVIVEVEKQ